MDTWHNKLGNIFDDHILSRKVKPGYDFYEMKTDFVEGNAGHIAFWSHTAGEYFYSHYMPVGVDLWMVQMTVPESVVLAKAIQIRRVTDALTGLLNRNCYERRLEGYGKKAADSLCCLYIDANGLHELNNSLGHAAGDDMLVCIGLSLKELFSPEDCYRIGGDEFAVFCTGCGKKELRQRVDRLKHHLDASGYHVSIGEAWLRESLDIKEMITTAEKNMYEAKRLYYQQTGKLPRARLTVPT